MEGWISLHRKLLESDLWKCEPFTRGQAWVDLLLLANHKDSFFFKRGVRIDVKRGQVGRSEVELSDRWSWSRNKVRKFLKDMEKEQQIEQHKNNVTQLLTIVNYSEYQEKGQQTKQQKNSRKTPKGQQKDTYNNVNNENNENNENKKKRFTPPSLDQVKQYCLERKNNVNADKFIDHYTSNGWMVGKNKMKDWKAAIRTWEKNNYDSSQTKQTSMPVSDFSNITEENKKF